VTRTYTTAVGVGLILVGIVGFFLPFPGLLDLNPAHDVVHVGTGLAALAITISQCNTLTIVRLFGFVYLAVGIIGLGITNLLEIIPLDPADTVIHFALAAATLAIGFLVLSPDVATA
jgi:hypothetical protein